MSILYFSNSANKTNPAQKFIKLLKAKSTTLLKRVEKEVCSICLDELDVDKKVCLLRCTHMFHENCIVEWLGGENTCPLCRCKVYENTTVLMRNRRPARRTVAAGIRPTTTPRMWVPPRSTSFTLRVPDPDIDYSD